MSPAWVMVLIAGIGCICSIVMQYIMAGRYMERVDNLVKEVNQNKADVDRDVRNIRLDVNELMLSFGKLNASIDNVRRRI